MTVSADDALAEHSAFERGTEGYELSTTPFETVVQTDASGSETRYRVVTWMPTLDAVVEGETVADVVEEGWLETLERRLDDPTQVTTGLESVESEVVREGERIRVGMTFESSRPDRAVENAKALAEFVEGTWIQGIVPGYEYGEPASSLLDRATQNYEED